MVDVDAGERSLERRQSFVLGSQPLSNRLVHLNIVLKIGKCLSALKCCCRVKIINFVTISSEVSGL